MWGFSLVDPTKRHQWMFCWTALWKTHAQRPQVAEALKTPMLGKAWACKSCGLSASLIFCWNPRKAVQTRIWLIHEETFFFSSWSFCGIWVLVTSKLSQTRHCWKCSPNTAWVRNKWEPSKPERLFPVLLPGGLYLGKIHLQRTSV